MTPTSAPINVSSPAEAGLVHGRRMARSLMHLLDRVRGARDVLPHLAALERGLVQQGVDAIARIPPHWLAKICSQLSSLPLRDDDAPLQELLDRLLQALRGQEEPAPTAGFDATRTVVIREISHSEFDAANAEFDAAPPVPETEPAS